MTEFIRVVKWAEFQHYKDRDPIWIKLHRSLLDNYEYGLLPDSAKAHVIGLWLLAARHDNRIPADAVWIGQRIGASTEVNLTMLISTGLFEFTDDALPEARPADEWGTRYVSKEVREAVWKRDTGKCQGCGCVATCSNPIEYDHRTPVSKGGDGSISNIWLLCRKCNRRKRIQSVEQPATQTSASAESRGEERREEKRREEPPPAERTFPMSWSKIVQRMSREPDRWAVVDFLENVPGNADGWIPVLMACLEGLDMPGGRPATPEAIAATCRDFATKPAADWTPKFFRACLGRFRGGADDGIKEFLNA
jgi:hypothetical protein